MGQLCTFYLDGSRFCIDVAMVQEVLKPQPMTEVPLASARIQGLINLRGRIVSAINLRKCFGMDPGGTDSRDMNVVVRVGESVVSLIVDQIGDVVEVDEQQFERVPDTLNAKFCDLVQQICKLPNDLLLVLDPARVVAGME
ncbi:MAG: chemotaxis protein CheW [Polyangiaceae bacterium]|nr:chemotaxis protein CheW [Myxococcales bacterium]MCB9590866.1 chemotaxis protein CheW [Polyangiaceae bacterium]